MKFNDFFIIKYIYLIIFSVTISSCSSFKNYEQDYKKEIDLGYFEPVNTEDDNKMIDDKTQLKINKLQSINIIYFPLDRYHILPEFFSILDMHATFLRNQSFYQIRIEGHTDERGTPEYNIALGERRAYAVKMYLQSRGVLSNQIEIVSYGKEKPACYGHTEQAYSKNRRVVLIY